MLVPLGIGLIIKARYAELADSWVHTVGQISSVAMLLGVGAALFVSWQDIVGAIGSWIFIGTAIVLVAGLVYGLPRRFRALEERHDRARVRDGTAQHQRRHSWWPPPSAAMSSCSPWWAHWSSPSCSSSSPLSWASA